MKRLAMFRDDLIGCAGCRMSDITMVASLQCETDGKDSLNWISLSERAE